MASVTPKYVWAEGLAPTRIRNLYPATYERDPEIVSAMLAKCEDQAARARRCVQRALIAGEQRLAAAHRKEVDRFEEYARNCRVRLGQFTGAVKVATFGGNAPAEAVELSAFKIAAE